MPLPFEKNRVVCKCVFNVKYKSNGPIDKYKFVSLHHRMTMTTTFLKRCHKLLLLEGHITYIARISKIIAVEVKK